MSTPFVAPHTELLDVQAKRDFVILPYGPSWYIARVEEVLPDTRVVCVEFVYPSSDGSFSFKQEGDAGYEGFIYEPLSLVLLSVPAPSIHRVSDRRQTMRFATEVLEPIDVTFNEWKQKKRHAKVLYRK